MSFRAKWTVDLALTFGPLEPVTMTYWTGMRFREILKISWDKVDLANGIIKLEAADTNEEMPKRIPIS